MNTLMICFYESKVHNSPNFMLQSMQVGWLLHRRLPVGVVRPLADHERAHGGGPSVRRLHHDPHRPHHALLDLHLLLDAARQATAHPH